MLAAHNVLLTGATGWAGSLVLERLLRPGACARLILLVRPRSLHALDALLRGAPAPRLPSPANMR